MTKVLVKFEVCRFKRSPAINQKGFSSNQPGKHTKLKVIMTLTFYLMTSILIKFCRLLVMANHVKFKEWRFTRSPCINRTQLGNNSKGHRDLDLWPQYQERLLCWRVLQLSLCPNSSNRGKIILKKQLASLFRSKISECITYI